MENNIILLIGPSGSGKTTVANYLETNYGMKMIQSYTTRAPRYPGETGHEFISDEEFDQLKNIIAYTEFDGHRYAATQGQVDTHDIYVIDLTGARTFQHLYHGNKKVLIVYLKISPEECAKRMASRGDTDDGISGRIANDAVAFDGADMILKDIFDTVLVLNNNTVPELARMIAEFAGRAERGIDDCGN